MQDNIISLVHNYNKNDIRNNNFIFDRFDIIECKKPKGYLYKQFKPPSVCTKSLVDICKDRAKELGTVNVAWSGGVDSTFILAVYKSLGINVIPVMLKDYANNYSAELFSYVADNFDLQIKSINDVNVKLITGSTADVLFDSIARRNGGVRFNGNGKRFIVDLENPSYDKSVLWLNEYADKIGVRLETENDILRLVMLCFKYYHYCYNTGVSAFIGVNQESFFDTQEFTDYAFTNCWNRQELLITDKTYKKIQKDFIYSVFGSDFEVHKND